MTSNATAKVTPLEGTVEKTEARERERSRIEFPYVSLDEASRLAKGVFDLGSSCQIDQLAGHLGHQSSAGGGFRMKLQAARTFGLITFTQGTATLTDLGSRLFDPDAEREAKAAAFLKVPLYNAVYEQYKGKMLPGNVGLEGAMVNLGVSAKQKEKARQAFQRSAKEAGFFAYGTTKLVYPVLAAPDKAVPKDKAADIAAALPGSEGRVVHGSGGGEPPHKNPFIQGLLSKLPTEDTEWSIDDRRKWLQLAISVFEVTYKSASGDSGALTINQVSAK